MFSNLPIAARLYAIVGVSLVASIALAAILYSKTVQSIYDMRELHLRDLVDSSISLLDDLNNQVEAGEITLEDAKARGAQILNAVRYEGSNYFFGFDYDMAVQVHGGNSALIGTDQSNTQDSNGVYLYREMRQAAVEEGGGIVFYGFKRAAETGSDEVLPKMSFARAYPAWQWVIGTGSYIEDMEIQIAAVRNTAIASVLGGVLIVCLISWYVGGTITRPIATLKNRMIGLSEGDLQTDIPNTLSRDEVGAMARALDSFRVDLQRGKAIERETAEQAEVQRGVVAALGRALNRLKNNDLTCEIKEAFPEQYESLRFDLNSAVGAMRGTVGSVAENAEEIRIGAHDISRAAQDLSVRTEKQAAALELTAISLEEMTGTVTEAAQNASNASKLSEQTQRDATEGGKIAKKTIDSMNAIKDSSSEISKISSVIDDIAFQTNLLALNAGVEAARAGEAGKGFAVVASEVRALAQRSSDAAHEITELISSSRTQVNEGVSLVTKTGSAFETILTSIDRITQEISVIAASAKSQSSGLSEINVSVGELDQVTQQNAAMFEQTTAASHSLSSEVDRLNASIKRFNLSDQPDKSQRAA